MTIMVIIVIKRCNVDTNWTVAEAKAKLSEVIARAEARGRKRLPGMAVPPL